MKEKVVNTRMSEELYCMLCFKAKAAGINNSELIRRSISSANITFNESKDLSSLLAELNEIRNNLKQMLLVLDVANQYDALPEIDYEDIKEELLLISFLLGEIIK